MPVKPIESRAVYYVEVDRVMKLATHSFDFASGYAYAQQEAGKRNVVMTGRKDGDEWQCVVTLPAEVR